jgi:hypothetical protein
VRTKGTDRDGGSIERRAPRGPGRAFDRRWLAVFGALGLILALGASAVIVPLALPRQGSSSPEPTEIALSAEPDSTATATATATEEAAPTETAA